MSTVTAVLKHGKIAIACDSLLKWGSEKNSAKHVVNHDKIIQINDSYIAITGPAAGILALKHYFKHTENKFGFDTVEEIFITFRDLQESLKEDYHLDIKNEETGFEPNSMYCLIANPRGIFAVGSYRDVQQFKHYYSYGSGNEYALGAMHEAFKNDKYTADEVAHLGIMAAAEFDDATEAPIISYVMDAQK
jgi:ATP-dependent HslUV protease, peptidase subunit HslV